MNKLERVLLQGIVLGALFSVLGALANAGNIAISPKEVYVLSYTTSISTVSPVISANATGNAAYMPGAVYQIIQSTGAYADYTQLYDSTGTIPVAVCGSAPTSVASFLGPRIIVSSGTQNTVTRFDPPLVFHNGLVACNSSNGDQTAIIYELGRGLNGQ